MITQSGTKTVRYMFPIVISIIAILSASVISGINSSYVELVPSKTEVLSGEQFLINVIAYAHVPVNALDLTVDFIPGVIEVTGIDIGESVLTIWTEDPVVKNNSITFSGGTYRRGFVGEHLIATINVKALKTGQTEFSVKDARLLAGDGSGSTVKLSASNTKTTKSFIIYDEGEEPGKITAALGVGITADIDGDGKVTLKDVSSFMAAWYSGTTEYDFNNDSNMNFIDFSIILARSFFGSSTQ